MLFEKGVPAKIFQIQCRILYEMAQTAVNAGQSWFDKVIFEKQSVRIYGRECTQISAILRITHSFDALNLEDNHRLPKHMLAPPDCVHKHLKKEVMGILLSKEGGSFDSWITGQNRPAHKKLPYNQARH